MKNRYEHFFLFIFGLMLLFFGVIFNLSTKAIKTSEVGALFFVGIGLVLLTRFVKKKAI